MDVTRYHQLHVKTAHGERYTVDISCNKTSVTYVNSQAEHINIKVKKHIQKEYNIYEHLLNQEPDLFLIEHTFDQYPHINTLRRHNLTLLSIIDIYGVIKSENWTPLYLALTQVNHHKLPLELLQNIKAHTISPQHTCCLLCRRFLAELGLFMHKLNKRVFETTKHMLKHYNFVLTADNVDLNGILDFEDYIPMQQNLELKDILRKMQPYYHTLYSIYEHLGMYFISQPIYNRPITEHDDLITRFEEVIYKIRNTPLDSKFDDTLLYRPTIQYFAKYLHLNTYAVEPEPLWNIYDNIDSPNITIPGLSVDDLSKIILKPTRPYDDYIDLATTDPTLLDGDVYCRIDYQQISNLTFLIPKINENAMLIEIYIENHIYELNAYNHMLKVTLNIWLANMYDANVNLSHFDSINYHNNGSCPGKATFPIVGEVDATLLHECKICSDLIPNDIKSVYDIGTNIHARAQLEDYKPPRRVNPLVEFDTALLKIGTFRPENDYAYTMKTSPDHIIDYELKQYLAKQGLTALIPPLNLNPAVHDPSTTFTSPYYIKTPSEQSIREDLNMYNQNTAVGASPTVLLMAVELLHQLLTDTILSSDGKPNCPMVPSEVPVRNKHKSSGTPYRKLGDAEFMRDVYGEYRDKLVYHKRHSADQALTLVINKVAISTKHRDRTILAININKSEAGRSLYRWFLDKIKATANTGGPIVIGLVAQYGGWDKLYKNLYKNSPIDNPDASKHVVIGGKDFPKWDRRITNMLQLTATNVFFNMIDQWAQQIKNEATPQQTWHEYFSETTQVLYDYLVFLNELIQKPAGVTSGNSRTADGNSLLHLLIELYSIIVQLIQSDPDNVGLESRVRSDLCKTVFETIPSDYIQQPPLRKTNVLTHIRSNIAKGLVLSDDGLILFDTRIIKYDDFMAESHMLSKYSIATNKHKYHIDSVERKAREFLSQDTFDFGNMSFPLPDFGRIFSAMLLSDNKNVLDPKIYITRLLSLFSIAYLYYFKYYKEVTHPTIKLLDALRSYIDSLLETTEEQFLDCIVLPDGDAELDLRNCDIYENFDRLWDLVSSSAYIEYLSLNRHRYKRLSLFGQQLLQKYDQTKLANEHTLRNQGTYVSYNCYVCGGTAYLTCATCERVFCNSIDKHHGSHIEQHLQYSGHDRLYLNCKLVRCKHCYITDINKLYTSGRDLYFCNSHKPPNAVSLITNNEDKLLPPRLFLCVIEPKLVSFYEQCYRNYTVMHPLYPIAYDKFMSLVQTYLSLDYQYSNTLVANRIRVCMRLASFGIVRPYHQLIMQLTKIESKVIDASVIDINITPTNIQEVGTCFIEVPQEYKLDQHSTYAYLIGNREVVFTPTYHSLSLAKTSHIWKTDIIIPNYCTYIRQRRLNTLSAILRNQTQHVPEFTRLLLSWNQTLPITARQFPVYKPSVTLSAQPNVVENINILLSELNEKRFKIMFGGPGTGKSHTLSILINHLHSNGMRILVYTPSHQSANALLFKIANLIRKRGIRDAGLVRIVTDGMKEEIKPHPFITYRASMCDKDRICVTTIQSFSTVQHVKDIDLVILDEFSLTSDNYMLTGLSHLKPSTRCLFSGDPRQLSGVDELRKVLDPRFHTLINYYTETYPKEVHVLKYHFRCHPVIFDFFKGLYYADKDMACSVMPEDRLIRPLQPINTVPVGEPTYRSQGVVLNQDETDKVLDILVLITQTIHLHYSLDYQPTVAIICSYKSQLQNFMALQQKNLVPDYVKLSTIDSAQGDEFDIVILCLSQVNNFTLNPNRFNVAVSRARSVLFITVPPQDRSISFLYKDVYKTLITKSHFKYFKIYNESGRLIVPQDNTVLLRNHSTNYINIRNLAGDSHKLKRKYPMNVIKDDYIFFDTEFLNPHDAPQEPVVLSYGFTSVHGSRRISGTPMRYVKDKFNNLVPTEYKFKDYNKPLTSTYVTNWLRHRFKEQFDHLNTAVKFGISAKVLVNAKHMLNFCINNIHVKPVIVTWAGVSDHKFLIANTLYPPIHQTCNIVPRCNSPPIYASPQGCHTYYLCSYHAQLYQENLNITHFVNLEIIDLTVSTNKQDVKTLSVTHNNEVKLILTLNEAPKSGSLDSIHSHYCNTKHKVITPHDPLDDAIMTRCVFESLVKSQFDKLLYEQKANLTAFLSMDYRLRNFDPDMCKLRRELQQYWYQIYTATTNKTHCNNGCGKVILKDALCNIDIKLGRDANNNMNTHNCNAQEEIYFDSHWYKTTPYTKSAYVFSDINPKHYYNLGTTGLCLYLNSKQAKYCHPFNMVIGTDVFKTQYYTQYCDLGRLTHDYTIKDSKSIPDCILLSSNVNCEFKNLVCNVHHDQLEIISKISLATDYGYQFIYVEPNNTLTPQRNIQRAPLDWDHTQVELLANTKQHISNAGLIKIKAQEILHMLQDSMLYTHKTHLNPNLPLIYFGAADFNGVPVITNELQTYLKRTNFINIDPRLTQIDKTNHKKTIKEMMDMGYNTELIIADIYSSNYMWIPELVEYTQKYLIENGTLILKITCTCDDQKLHLLDDLSKNFTYVRVCTVTATAHSSELWVVFANKRKPPVQGWIPHDLRNELRKQWYSMMHSPIIPKYGRVCEFKYSPK